MGLFAFPLREGSPDVNAWAIAILSWRRHSRWRLLISLGILIVAQVVIWLLEPGHPMRGALIGFGAGAMGVALGVSLGGLAFILRTRLFLDSAVTPLTTRDLVTAAQRMILAPMVLALMGLGGFALYGDALSRQSLDSRPYGRISELLPSDRAVTGERTEHWVRLNSYSSHRPPVIHMPKGEVTLSGTALAVHRSALILSLIPLGLAAFWLLLSAHALAALWEKTTTPLKFAVAILTVWIVMTGVVSLLIMGLMAGQSIPLFPLGPPPQTFQSPADFWPRTLTLIAAALFLAILIWFLGNVLWRRAARLPLDRIHETVQARLAKTGRVKA